MTTTFSQNVLCKQSAGVAWGVIKSFEAQEAREALEAARRYAYAKALCRAAGMKYPEYSVRSERF
jgi:hypothetical protein